MTRPRDTFRQFVTLLSTSLDDHAVRGPELAAQLYLSRSHFDRIVGGLAGETPGRFRRRVLLERAAYRLRTTDSHVLDIAVEAGYSSHEAFTRAFQRAYGVPPSQWRTAPAAIHLASANDVHFYPPGGLRLPSEKTVSTMMFVAGIVDHHVSVLGQLLDRAGALSDDQLDARVPLPAPGIDADPTVRSLLSRLVGQLDMWNRSMANEPYDFAVERHESVDSMKRRLASEGTRFAATVRDVSEHDRFGETFVDATCEEPYVFTMAGMIGHVLTYASYRRTAVLCALDAAGVQGIDDDPLTWFAPR